MEQENKPLLTLDGLKSFKPSEELIKTVEQVFLNMVELDIIKPIVTGYQKAILNKHKFFIADKHLIRGRDKEIILNPKHDYLLTDKDFKIYLSEVEQEHKKQGFNVKKDYCPLLIAEHNLIISKNKLIDLFEVYTGIQRDRLYKLDNRAKYIELLLNLMSKYVNKEQALKNYKGVFREGF